MRSFLTFSASLQPGKGHLRSSFCAFSQCGSVPRCLELIGGHLELSCANINDSRSRDNLAEKAIARPGVFPYGSDSGRVAYHKFLAFFCFMKAVL